MTTTAPDARTEAAGDRWTAWHLHLATHRPEHHDRLIHEVVAPVVADGGHQWFHIRYWNRGPHVRLRVADLGPGEADALERDLGRRLAAFLPGCPREVDAAAYAESSRHAAAFDRTDTASPGAFREPGVHRDRYVPETVRYGGAALLPLSHELFHRASRVALAAWPPPAGGGSRLTTGLQAMTAGLAALGGPEAVSRYLDRSLVMMTELHRASPVPVDRLVAAAERQAAAPAAAGIARALAAGRYAQVWEPWAGRLGEALAVWRAHGGGVVPPEAILASHLHMMANRLGVTPHQELQLVALLRSVLTRRQDAAVRHSTKGQDDE
ncbi:thiopeptide-type bacteriocin biosynthesis protein [Streptomyces cinnamoneus]|nr:thiopeptide-type bacteriocin biosynthesis protein [Streptomyces cinnamoneus]